MKNNKVGKIIVPVGMKPWTQEMRVAEILAMTGHNVRFLEESNLHTADILLDGVEFEIKSPKSANANSLEHLLKKALRQSPNIIIDTSRMNNFDNVNIKKFLISQMKKRKQIKKLIMITKRGQVVDISSEI